MRIFTLKRFFAVMPVLVVVAAMLHSCGGNATGDNEKQVAELQSQLDSTMQKYMELRSQNTQYDSEMSSRDSVIRVQAAEIQRLINSMKSSETKTITKTKTDKQVESQERELREKERTIGRLQKQLDEQSKQLKALQASKNGGDNSKNNDKQIAQLQKQIAEQERQIRDLKAEIESGTKTITKTKSDCEGMKKSYEEQVAGLNGDIKGYKNQIAELNKEIKALEAKTKTGTKSEEGSVVTREELRQMTVQLDECRKLNAQFQNDVKVAKDSLLSVKARESSCVKENEELKRSQQSIAQRCENDKQALQAKISDLQSQVLTLQTKVDEMETKTKTKTESDETKRIADLTAKVESQQGEIERLRSDLQKKEKELAVAKGTSKPSKDAVNQKLTELQELCDGYAAEIERLRKENERLRGENAELKEQVSSSAELIAENERLSQKVKLASVLVTSDLKATPGKSVKVGNVVKPTTKASQTNYVRLDCRLMDNNVIDPGSVTIYARISNAADRAISNGNAEEYVFDLNGVQMQYTTKQEIEFTGMGRNLTMLWKKAANVELGPGLYWVKLYANGYEIGKASFRLE